MRFFALIHKMDLAHLMRRFSHREYANIANIAKLNGIYVA